MALDATSGPALPQSHAASTAGVEFVDLGAMPYAEALAIQRRALEQAIAARDAGGWPGRIFLVEHAPPVITVTRRPAAAQHLLAAPERLAALGIEVQETDRGGDVTYHGPGQLVVYPILDLNALGLRIHGYMRFLEEVVLRVLARHGLEGWRDPTATGVWVGGSVDGEGHRSGGGKICALGVRVSRWTSMHGLALNVDPAPDHFSVIVPCGLHGRAVTSMRQELGPRTPDMASVKETMRQEFLALIANATASPSTPES